MKKIAKSSLLVAVRDLDRSARQLLKKAAAIAERFDAQLKVVHICSVPFAQSSTETWSLPQTTIDAFLSQQKAHLEKLVKPLREAGHEISCNAVWGYPVVDELLREITRTKPELLLISTRRHSRLGRWLLSNTDWELIRYCPCPLWIVKSQKSPQKLAAIAAVDPFHAHDKPARLDQAILDMAQKIAGAQGRVGVCHAISMPAQLMVGIPEALFIPPTIEETREYKARAAHAIDRLIGKRPIAKANRFVVEDEPANALNTVARRWKADVLVTGAVSRSALKRLFIGNTAERLLDSVDCDVVVVKVPQKKSRGA